MSSLEHAHIIGDLTSQRRYYRKQQLQQKLASASIASSVMVAAALLAIVVANTSLGSHVHHILETSMSFSLGSISVSMSLEAFVNDFLMAIFFLLVGVELKHEVTVGELRKPRQAALPMLAAVGGVCVPAVLYLLFNQGATANGWAVPIATDIAFALGVISLLGDKISAQTKVFFQTLAIADDILAIVVLALFYGHTPNVAWLAATGLVILLLFFINRAHVYSLKPYIVVGLLLWLCMYMSGIHATLAGVILAFFLPAKTDVKLSSLHKWLSARSSDLDSIYDGQSHILGQHHFMDETFKVEEILHRVTPPLVRLDRRITLPVNFVILPLFAFVNAQVALAGVDVHALLFHPVFLGVLIGAVVGKPVGIVLVTYCMERLGVGKLSSAVSYKQVCAVGLMGGMGFTMSILIAGLAFTEPADVLAAKCAILLASVIAGALGSLFIWVFERTPQAQEA